VLRGLFILWAGEIPVRYSDINRLPPWTIRAVWGIQVLLLAAASVGAYSIARTRPAAAWLLVTPLLYVTAVHVPFLTEARQSLPAQPTLLVLATVGVTLIAGQFRPTRATRPT
jgi:hypothetical protein